MAGTRIVATDIETGQSEEATIENNYVIVTDGSCYISSEAHHANGTVQITIKGRR